MIKYVGKKILNSNFYKKVSLIKDGDDIKVKVAVDEKFKNILTIKTDTKLITEQIEGLSDFGKIKEIVLYFLRNNKICSLEQHIDKIVVGSTSSRQLILKLDNKYKDLINIIINKYENDRLEFVNNYCEKDVYITGVTSGISSYCLGDNIVLRIMRHNENIISFDKNFLKEYLKNIIDNCKSYIKTNNDYFMYDIHIDGIKISLVKSYIPPELLHDIYVMVFNRNYDIDFKESKQYKLEGIK